MFFNWETGRLWTTEELIIFLKVMVKPPFTRYNRLSQPAACLFTRCSRLFYRFDNRLYRVNGVLGSGLGMVQQSIDVKSESEVGKTSYGTVRENLDRRTAGNDTVPISVWRGGGVSSTECRSRLLFCICTTFLTFSLVLPLYT